MPADISDHLTASEKLADDRAEKRMMRPTQIRKGLNTWEVRKASRYLNPDGLLSGSGSNVCEFNILFNNTVYRLN